MHSIHFLSNLDFFFLKMYNDYLKSVDLVALGRRTHIHTTPPRNLHRSLSHCTGWNSSKLTLRILFLNILECSSVKNVQN